MLWFMSWVNFSRKAESLSLSGVPVTLSCVLSIFTTISPLSSTTGSPVLSSMNMLATRTESMEP